MTEIDFTYGPPRPEKAENYSDFRTEYYVRGHARKILHDLEKLARLYNGKKVRIYQVLPSARCELCTDSITGAVVIPNCTACNGTGQQSGYTLHTQLKPSNIPGHPEEINEFWAHIEVIPIFNVTSELGNADTRGGTKTPVMIIGLPLLKDGDLVATVNTKDVYKIVNIEPQIVAVQGTVIAQLTQCNLISRGSAEYRVIDW